MRLNELDSTRLRWEAPTRGFESHHARCKVIEWQTMNCGMKEVSGSWICEEIDELVNNRSFYYNDHE